LFFFYQILTSVNNLNILSELVLLLPNIDSFQQFEDFVSACSTFTKYRQLSPIWNCFVRTCSTSSKYWPLSTIWRFLSELVLLLLNTDHFQQFGDFCQNLFYFYQILTAFNNLEIFVRDCSSTKYWQLSTIWRFCQSLFYFYQILIAFKNLKNFVKACSTSTKYWPLSTIWRFLSELVLLLPNTDSLQQFGDFCQRLFFYQILTAFNNLKILSELIPLLPNTDSFQEFEKICQS
jgi:hypothetical protein